MNGRMTEDGEEISQDEFTTMLGPVLQELLYARGISNREFITKLGPVLEEIMRSKIDDVHRKINVFEATIGEISGRMKDITNYFSMILTEFSVSNVVADRE